MGAIMTTGDEQPIDAADQSENEPLPQEESPDHQQHVPVSVVQAMRDEMKALKQHVRSVDDRHELSRRLLAQYEQQQKQKEQPLEEDPLLDEHMTKREAQVLLERKLAERERKYQFQLQEDRFERKNPDYQQVVDDFFAKAVQEDPDLQEEVANLHAAGKVNIPAYVYKRCKQSKAYQETNKKEKKSETAERIASNVDRPPSLSTLGKSSSAGSSPGFYSRMSNDDFQARLSKVKAMAS